MNDSSDDKDYLVITGNRTQERGGLVELMPETVLELDRTGLIIYANRAASVYFDGNHEDLTGKTIYDILPKEIADRQLEAVRNVCAGGKACKSDLMTGIRGEQRWFAVNVRPLPEGNDAAGSALLIAYDITDRKLAELRDRTRFHLFDKLRVTDDIDNCLESGCRAIYDARLFKRSVLTLHNMKRQIIHLGWMGLDDKVVEAAKNAPPPDDELAAQITRQEYRIHNSYFIPCETGISIDKTPRYITPVENIRSDPSRIGADVSPWKKGDELFVPVRGITGEIEGWLSADTPFNGCRPTKEVIIAIEELVGITAGRIRELKSLQDLEQERQALHRKNIALGEILDRITERKIEIKKHITESINENLLPVLDKLLENDGDRNGGYADLLKNGLRELASFPFPQKSIFSRLTPREAEICLHIKSGKKSKEIADTLNLSCATVHKHRERIRRKLKINNKGINLSTYLRKYY